MWVSSVLVEPSQFGVPDLAQLIRFPGHGRGPASGGEQREAARTPAGRRVSFLTVRATARRAPRSNRDGTRRAAAPPPLGRGREGCAAQGAPATRAEQARPGGNGLHQVVVRTGRRARATTSSSWSACGEGSGWRAPGPRPAKPPGRGRCRRHRARPRSRMTRPDPVVGGAERRSARGPGRRTHSPGSRGTRTRPEGDRLVVFPRARMPEGNHVSLDGTRPRHRFRDEL